MIYLLDINLNVKFTGCVIQNDKVFNTILDGELVLFNKKGEEFGRIMGSIDFNNLEFINWLKQYN